MSDFFDPPPAPRRPEPEPEPALPPWLGPPRGTLPGIVPPGSSSSCGRTPPPSTRTSIHGWVWPLPPPGPLAFVCEWPAAGLELTRREIEAQALIDAAARAQALFPSH